MLRIFLVSLLAVVAACDPVTSKDADGGGGGSDGGSDGDAAANRAPTGATLDNDTVPERSLPGTVVGTLSAVDPDTGDTHTFTLTDDPSGGGFTISGDELQIADGELLNYESGAAILIEVEVEDAAGATATQSLTINLTDRLEVTNVNDSGPGSLRQALIDVAPGETVLFEVGVGGNIDLQTPLVFNRSVTVRGNAARVPNLNGRTVIRSLQVDAGATVNLIDLAIIQGSASSGACAINNGTLELERVAVRDCTISSSSGRGGGIQNFGTLRVIDSVFQRCKAFNGGGIAHDGGTLLIRGSTFVDNDTTGNSGGAIGTSNPAVILNSTFVDNDATGSNRVGGAIAIFGDQTTVIHSTIAGNTATGAGGGIYVGSGGTLSMGGTLVSGNTGATGPDVQGDGTTLSTGYNLLGDGANSGYVNGQNNDQVGVTQAIGALSNNGGPTETRLIPSGSPAHDAIPAASCLDPMGNPLTVDQRGLPRPVGNGCDIGAVEVQ